MKLINYSRFVFIHIFCLFLVAVSLHFSGVVHILPLGDNLLKWDATWYNSIRTNDYSYATNIQSNSGFYPLFPIVWRVLHVSALQMSVINGLLSLLALAMLSKAYEISPFQSLIFISLPSLFFLYVPYAESLFFCCCTLLLIGLKENKHLMVFAGLFLASTTKATAIFFIPAILFTELLIQEKSSINWFVFFRNTLFYSFAVIVGTASVVLLQHAKTGVWFAYFKAQSAHWNRQFNFPSFPLTTWDANQLLALDAFAFTIGIFSLLLAAYLFLKWLNNKPHFIEAEKTSLIFSLSFLALALGSILFFNPIDGQTKTTSILSINRYLFASPFLLILIQYLGNLFSRNKVNPILVIGFFCAISLLFGSYHSLKIGLLFLALSLYCCWLFYEISKKEINLSGYFLYFLNLVLQIFLFYRFIDNKWVG